MPLAKDPASVQPPKVTPASHRRKLTAKEKNIRSLKYKKAAAERSLRKLQGQDKAVELEDVLSEASELPNEELEKKSVFTPNPGPQTEFFAAPEFEVLYGGAAGGGKSYGMLVDPLRNVHNPNHMALIVRRTTEELRELVMKSQQLYPLAVPGARWSQRQMTWTFPSGAKIWFSYLEQDQDVMRYQGQQFTYVGFDELTQWPTPFCWNYLRSRVRTVDPNLKCYMRATTNPGGPGHLWVKKMFIDPAPYGQPFWARNEDGEVMMVPPKRPDGTPHPDAGKPLFKRRFIQSKLYDNPYLMHDNSYEYNLLSLTETEQKRLLQGDWDVAEGAVFSEWDAKVHVCEPFDIPHTWRRFRSCDFGYGSFSAVHWFAIDPNFGTLYVYRELYVSKYSARDLGRAILSIENASNENISYGVLDSSCWHDRGTFGPTIAEEMIQMGVRWKPSDRSKGSRVHGANRLHELLRVDEDREKPGIIFFNTCRQAIADIPSLPRDDLNPDDVYRKAPNDHTYDSIRYGIMTRPAPVGAFESWFKSHGTPGYQSAWKPSDPVFGY